MATIAYSLAGEGRGHATRAKTIIDQLIKRQHQVVVFAPDLAFQFLSRVYQFENRVSVEAIPGLMFHYTTARLDFSKTTVQGMKFLFHLPALIGTLQRRLSEIEPDLVITDFEPALPRAATRMGIPWMSIDHQHFLAVSDLSGLPKQLQWKAWGMSQVVKAYYDSPDKMVVSSFYFPPLRVGYENVVQTGVLLRERVALAQPETHDHLIVYLRRYAHPKIMSALEKCGSEVRVYGLSPRRAEGCLRFLPISDEGFLEDLRTCRALISTAGNQLLGEAMFLRKRCFVFPEERNFEQEINARFLGESGAGTWVHLSELEDSTIRRFTDNLDQYECEIPRSKLNGNNATLQVIDSMLPVPERFHHTHPTELART